MYRSSVAVLAIVFVIGAPGVAAQEGEEPTFCRLDANRAFDLRGLRAVYCLDGVAATGLQWAHASADPVFYGAVPAAWSAVLVRGGTGRAPAYRLTLTQLGTFGGVMALKRVIGRPRPYLRHPLDSRSSDYHRSSNNGYTSLPSGHAALSAALATSWGLSYPRWYVVAPGALWALGVSLSRLHLGVHYPTDLVAGVAFGIAVAGVVHALRDPLTPDRLQEDAAPAPMPVSVRIRF